jgi:hypothetical protein
MSKLAPSHPFLGVGPGSIIPRGSISLPVTLRMHENYRMESVVFDVGEVNLPFNAILGRPTLYRFMAITHYRYLVLKMSTPNSIIKIHGDRYASAFTLQKLQALVAAQQDAAGHDELDQAPSSSLQRGSTSAPRMQPSDNEDITVKISTDSAQTTHIVENLSDK